MTAARYQNLGLRLSLRRLWSGLGIEVVSTAWSRARHPERSAGAASYFAIELMRAGSFEKRLGRRRVLADPGVAVFFNPGEEYEIRHPVGRDNTGTTLRIEPSRWDELRIASGAHGFRQASVPLPASLLLAVHRLGGRLSPSDHGAPPGDALALEEDVLSVVQQAVQLDAPGRTAGCAEGRDETAPAAGAERRAQLVREFLNASFARPIRLADVAAAADCSLWHVSKQFRRATGSTIHAYLLRLRLRHALEALHQGADDLTRLALDFGFSSHSHFTSAFRAEFGLTPRAARCMLTQRPGTSTARR